MKQTYKFTWLAVLCGLAGTPAAQPAAAVSEKDFLEDVPVVLSVSRLPQRLDETPGAVTIIDRQMIRMSGARDVADLLRFVPGFRVSNSFESNSPQGSYHTNQSDYSNHMQVLVDGRSVYSTYLQGSTGPGLQTVALEDIERIEVHRGSNSAAYGARAFLGTINIVTRDTVDTLGTQVQVAGGDNGIQDGLVRLGWGDEQARYRLSADGRADDGLRGASGGARVQRVNLRADIRVGSRDLVEFRTGQSVIDAGVGFAGDSGNNARTRQIGTSFVQLDWRRALGVDEDLAMQVSHTEEVIQDRFPYVSAPPVVIDFGGRATNQNLSAQHTLRANRALRLVWGGELRRETIVSRPLYDTDAAFLTDFSRVFANAEWRLHSDLLLNAGALFERSTIAGDHLSPRLMLNWRVAQGHTLRYGLTTAFRPPSNFEKYANVRYYLNGNLADVTNVSRGNVVSEKVTTRELGYLAELPGSGLNLDVRVFEEAVRNYIKTRDYPTPGIGTDGAKDYVNDEDFNIRGYEYQLKWRPWQDGQLIYGQSVVDSSQAYNGDYLVGRYGSQSMMFMQRLTRGFQFSLMHFQADASQFVVKDQRAPAYERTDIRIARTTRFGGWPAEISLVVQNLGPKYQDFGPSFYVRQQAYMMLRLEN
ncbi:MAG: TonB-dependent receptor [Hylemonella sp.]|nr:TonB-dependent receptor [Hylemonella sp.]